jgi:glyoxylase-like metal-dependent hydrolase (beta-lactamase superfamily II)
LRLTRSGGNPFIALIEEGYTENGDTADFPAGRLGVDRPERRARSLGCRHASRPFGYLHRAGRLGAQELEAARQWQAFPVERAIVSGQRRALIVDTTWPTGDMRPLLKTARDLTGNRPLQIVVTHAHDDRMSGLEIARAMNVKSLAHALTQADAESRGLPPADEAWDGKRKSLALGGRTARLFRPGPAHTRDNIVVFVEPADLLFGGCMIRSAGTRSLGNTADGDIASWASSVDAIIAEFGDRIQIVVPGHGDPGGPELLEHTKKLAAIAAKEAR